MLGIRSCIFWAVLLCFFSVAEAQQDGSVLQRRVSIHFEKQPLGLVLEQISWQAGVFFSYNASLIDASEKVSVDAENKSLYQILTVLFPPETYFLRELDDQIIIAAREDVAALQNLNDSVSVKYFFLEGKVLEERRGRPLPYASVSVMGKPIGTITNAEGDFVLKIHPDLIRDTLVVSCLGYSRLMLPAANLLDDNLLVLAPVSIRLREVKVRAVNVQNLLRYFQENRDKNYPASPRLMTAFYRETLQQDGRYISVSEAVLEILKASYANKLRPDLVRLLKGRKSPDVQPFRWLNFKLQGGPFTMTRIDVVKTRETFLDEDFREAYRYEIVRSAMYNNYPVYVVRFTPAVSDFYPAYEGEMYVEKNTFAVVFADFRLSKQSLKEASDLMIRRKPGWVKARSSYVHYTVHYQQFQGRWHLASARAAVRFKVRSKRDKSNSEFFSVSDLLVTNIQSTTLKSFPKEERFRQEDVFVEKLGSYDDGFWGNYNIIKPDEDLRKAFKAE